MLNNSNRDFRMKLKKVDNFSARQKREDNALDLDIMPAVNIQNEVWDFSSAFSLYALS